MKHLSVRPKLPGEAGGGPLTLGTAACSAPANSVSTSSFTTLLVTKEKSEFPFKIFPAFYSTTKGASRHERLPFIQKYIIKLIYQQLYHLCKLPLLLGRDLSGILCPSQ